MAPRAYWKGWLRLEAISCPVRLYAAATRANRISFHEINRDTGHRISLRPHDPETGKEVPKDEIVKGWEFEKGRYLLLPESEIDALRITPTKTIEISEFVPVDELDHAYFERPYYLAPDEGPTAAETFRVLNAALAGTGCAGIGRVVLSRADHAIALMPRERGFVMTTLRPPLDMRAEAEIFSEIGKGKLDAEMVDLAGIIIERRTGHFEPEQFEDRYQTALRRLVEAKLRGEALELQAPPPPAEIVDLKDMLRKAVAVEGKPSEQRRSRRRGEPRQAETKRRRAG